MGFCRRCGDIVPLQMSRCKCGGTAVAPTVPLNPSPTKGIPSDRWAKTYVSKTNSQNPAPLVEQKPRTPPHVPQSSSDSHNPTRPPRRFPRPMSTTDIPTSRLFASDKLSSHIASVTAPREQTSPHKKRILDSPGSSSPGIMTSPDNTTLAKAYGSILQPPETLPIHTCFICGSIFSPDATIYPDIRTSAGTPTQFLCRLCFIANGGSKGDCSACGREVTIIKKDGGFIECFEKVWHTRCFRCENCHKDIRHTPMVDLYGNPSCVDCFDTCTRRKSTPKKTLSELTNNIGGMAGRSREGSPALEELSERLGINRRVSRDGLSDHKGFPSKRNSPSSAKRFTENAAISADAVALSSSPNAAVTITDFNRAVDSTHQLPSTPPRCTKNAGSSRRSIDNLTPKAKTSLTPVKTLATENSKCDSCSQYLFKSHGNGKIITVPESDGKSQSLFHAACFRCFVCDNDFDSRSGQAVFIRDISGVRHPDCILRDDSTQCRPESHCQPASLSESTVKPLPKTAPADSRNFPRYRKLETCPGCCKSVSTMEHGVVTGPQSSRWHAACLVCGGKGAKLPRPGCGKKLDSGAKLDVGCRVVWCRECMLLLPPGSCVSPGNSPTRRLTASYTGQNCFPRPESRIFPDVTGSTMPKAPGPVTRQYTGTCLTRTGSISPTRQLTRSVSPTKGLMSATRRTPGLLRQANGEEGRGMFLVRQMTGTSQL